MGWDAFKRPFPQLHGIASRVRPVMHDTFCLDNNTNWAVIAGRGQSVEGGGSDDSNAEQ